MEKKDFVIEDAEDLHDALKQVFSDLNEEIEQMRKTRERFSVYEDQITRLREAFDQGEDEAVAGFAGSFLASLEKQGVDQEITHKALKDAIDAHTESTDEEDKCDVCGEAHGDFN